MAKLETVRSFLCHLLMLLILVNGNIYTFYECVLFFFSNIEN